MISDDVRAIHRENLTGGLAGAMAELRRRFPGYRGLSTTQTPTTIRLMPTGDGVQRGTTSQFRAGPSQQVQGQGSNRR